MANIAIIGGTGLARMDGLTLTGREMVKTPYGAPSCPLVYGTMNGVEIVFLSRHGTRLSIPAHRVNYRANIWALQSVGVKQVLAVGVVGGIHKDCKVGSFVVPDQIIDYTADRNSSFDDAEHVANTKIDFSYPYNHELRQALISGATESNVKLVDHGTYGASNGPRLETVAEIRRMESDGCSIVGMSGMPEASLAREVHLDYAFCGFVVNPAAGKGDGIIDTASWGAAVSDGVVQAQRVLSATLPLVK